MANSLDFSNSYYPKALLQTRQNVRKKLYRIDVEARNLVLRMFLRNLLGFRLGGLKTNGPKVYAKADMLK